ncbi:uncharacterized protein TNCT_531112 [Trichonephila clavata]|uniref:Uncharacterized protein n=1 Tax=Trichonephila clavata TaxID=2740835 RepID=A0A8X6LK34_TRICU|nr:uncharacterized protein TNCT_531112 [Trichonephila clavata]
MYISNGSWIHELKTKKIFLTNTQENTGPIEVLLGADVSENHHQVFREWSEEVIEEVPGKKLPVGTYYLPHRPVIKETSTTSSMKIRAFFHASAKIHNRPSLNDCLETGSNEIESIPSILTRD